MSNTKKSLLNENTIRRFMKLAEIDTLSDGFVEGLVVEGAHEDREKEMKEMAHPPKRDDEGEVKEEGMGGMDMGMAYDRDDDMSFEGDPEGPDEGPMVDADLDMKGAEAEAPEASEVPESRAALAGAIEQLMDVISDMTGEEIHVGAEAEGDEDDMAPAEDDMAPAEDDMALAGDDMDDEDADMMAETNLDELKEEVYRRVAARLQQESRKETLADQLSERILQRIKEQSEK